MIFEYRILLKNSSFPGAYIDSRSKIYRMSEHNRGQTEIMITTDFRRLETPQELNGITEFGSIHILFEGASISSSME